ARASFNPSGPLAAGTIFTATITTEATDTSGRELAATTSWTFTTGAAADSVAPTVLSTIPIDTATSVPTNQVILATFSEAINAATHVASFNPAGDLPGSTTITATIMTGAQDLAGNGLATNKVWSFTTGVAVDDTAPTVLSTIPIHGATGVATNQMLTATFSEAMNPATITALTFTVRGPGATPVTGTVAYSVATRVASF